MLLLSSTKGKLKPLMKLLFWPMSMCWHTRLFLLTFYRDMVVVDHFHVLQKLMVEDWSYFFFWVLQTFLSFYALFYVSPVVLCLTTLKQAPRYQGVEGWDGRYYLVSWRLENKQCSSVSRCKIFKIKFKYSPTCIPTTGWGNYFMACFVGVLWSTSVVSILMGWGGGVRATTPPTLPVLLGLLSPPVSGISQAESRLSARGRSPGLVG